MSTFAHLKQLYKIGSGFALSVCIALSATPAQAEVSQAPLLLGAGNIPGNLALVPSVEYPTAISVANTGNYAPASSYTGYFDAEKCYIYNENNEWFEPDSAATNHTCSGNKQWSGNFLNWAATPTIDPFRSALTGGYRFVDTATETVLEKAKHSGQSAAGNRMTNFVGANNGQGLISQADITGATPAKNDWDNFYIRLEGLGTDMLFSNWNDGIGGEGSSGTKINEWTNYLPSLAIQWDNNRLKKAYTPADNQVRSIYRVKIRVKVCVQNKGLENNCELYPNNNYKPVGLLQQYSASLRYSVFGYLNDTHIKRDGGILRAQQKFISPTATRPEWEANTGVMTSNPDSITTSLGRPINNSGVINYLNKFGSLNNNSYKVYDPVSELYYTALRYFKNQGNVPTYSTPSPSHNATPDTATLDRWHDNFPVLTSWEDPIQYACQKNIILGIGDTNTHADRNLPGGVSSTNEPTPPTEVQNDTSVNVQTATLRVGELEGLGTLNADTDTGLGGCCNNNSAYIAGLAYDAHTKDIRPTTAGKQTVSTHWVDVQENSALRAKSTNQYWLAAKYGGFKVPDDYGDPYSGTVAIPEAAWWTTGDILSTGNKRPDNFYVASDAAKMVASLKKAFVNIANEVQSTTASLATNSTRLGTDTAIFQSLLDSRRWSGDLLAKKVATNGVVASTASWSAADQLDALTSSEITSRKIFTNTPPTQATANGPYISTTGSNFNWAGLTSAQRTLFSKGGDSSLAESRLSFLRGDRTNEISIDNQNNPFRQRSSRMGDIVNSDPQLIHKQDFGYARLSWNDGAVGEAYTTFRQSSAYQARKPLIVVGANDGMLHGFDASISDTPSLNGGKELFAYVPNSVISNLTALTEPSYSHRYYVDGTPRVSDVWLGDATGWKTMVVGSTGAGGKSIFALDITNPGSMTSSNVMWEFHHPKMGYTIGQPALVALPNGKFAVIVSSGYHDTATTDGRIWILDAANGSIINEFTLPTTGGLGAPLAADTDYDLAADRIYIGDTLGNLWRVDLSKHNNGSLTVQTPNSLGSSPLFIAKDAEGNRQAITAPLSSAFNDKKEHMVYFGTGSFYRNGDNEVPATPKTDTFYGIIDGGALIDGRSSLLQQQILKEVSLSDGKTGRAVTQNTISATQKGWYMDLVWPVSNGGPGPKGERVVARATLRNDRVIFTTLTPAADPCAFGGSSFIMAVSRGSGARLNYSYFDADGDGDIDSDDMASLDNGGGDATLSGLSDPDNGVTKGVASLYKWLCFAGSSGAAPTCIPVSGSHTDGRKSWREVRSN